jgi:hypothetical protein
MRKLPGGSGIDAGGVESPTKGKVVSKTNSFELTPTAKTLWVLAAKSSAFDRTKYWCSLVQEILEYDHAQLAGFPTAFWQFPATGK